jgi:hypothetical protein
MLIEEVILEAKKKKRRKSKTRSTINTIRKFAAKRKATYQGIIWGGWGGYGVYDTDGDGDGGGGDGGGGGGD